MTIALRALGVGPATGGLSVLTFYATAEAMVNAGARPVFCDVDPDTACVTAETVARSSGRGRRPSWRCTCSATWRPVGEMRELGVPVSRMPHRPRAPRSAAPRPARSRRRPRPASSRRRTCGFGDGGAIATGSDEVAGGRVLRFHGSRDKRHAHRGGLQLAARLDPGRRTPDPPAGARRLEPPPAGRRGRSYERAGLRRARRAAARRPRGAQHVYHLSPASGRARRRTRGRALTESGHRRARVLPHARAPPARDGGFARDGAARDRRARGHADRASMGTELKDRAGRRRRGGMRRARCARDPSLRIGVVGLGYWGPNLARNFDALPEVTSSPGSPTGTARAAGARSGGASPPPVSPARRGTARGSRSSTRSRSRRPCRRTPSLRRACSRPASTCFVEKPLAQTTAEAEAVVAAARARRPRR